MTEGEAMYDRLLTAKAERRKGEAILELNEEGGGTAIWVPDEDRVVTCARLDKWKGCYGRWAVKKLNPEFAWPHDLGGEA
jgi:hypothetical protein